MSGIYTGKPSLNLARLITAFLLHLTLLSEMSSAKSMLDFARKNPSVFEGQAFAWPSLFAIFKLVGGLLCLFANVTILLRSETIEDVIKDYVAVHIISNVDNAMASVSKRFWKSKGLDLNLNLYMSHERAKQTDAKLFDEYVIESANAA